MINPVNLPAMALVAAFVVSASAPVQAQQPSMSFFVTSVGIGKGGDLGGLEGADRHCQSLAQAAGAGNKTWRAYLSTQGSAPVNAKDRIGRGPWFIIMPRACRLQPPWPTCTATTTRSTRKPLSTRRA